MVMAIRLCSSAGVAMIPRGAGCGVRGAGSGVCGGVLADRRSVVLSTDRMTGMKRFDETDLLATFAAGTLASDAEAAVAERGFTIGS